MIGRVFVVIVTACRVFVLMIPRALSSAWAACRLPRRVPSACKVARGPVPYALDPIAHGLGLPEVGHVIEAICALMEHCE